MSYFVSFDNTEDSLIFTENEKIVIKSDNLQFIRGFLTYVVNVDDMLTKFTANVHTYRDNHNDILYIFHDFKIESTESYDKYVKERENHKEWESDRSIMKKVAYYNKYWERYIDHYGFNTKRYIAYGRSSSSSFVIHFDTIEFLKGFQLAYSYHVGKDRLHIYQVHNGFQLCHQYITYSINPDYSNVDIGLRMTDKHSICYQVGYLETKDALTKCLPNDVIYIILGYFLSKMCQIDVNNLYDYRHQFTHCETLCDFGNSDLESMCAVCKTECVDYVFRGKPFGIDIRLEIAKDI
jgi:hypothetical protein